MLPFTNEELLEALVALRSDDSPEVRALATATIEKLDPESFIALASNADAPPDVLGFLCAWPGAPRTLVEAAVFNRATPDEALAYLATRSTDSAIIEAISLKQQSLIRLPNIIEAILANPARTPEAERRAREVQQEFFQKQYGAQMVAQEQHARAEAEEAARLAEEAARNTLTVGGIEDLIRLGLIEEGVDDSIVHEYENEFGPFDLASPTEDERDDIEKVVTEIGIENEAITPDRLPVFQQIALMSVKDRVMLAIKGTRDARMILARDPNRIVAGAVLRNPRLTDNEIESIASMKTAPEDVLRQIGQNRAWTKSYTVIHNLVRNPRTPIAIGLGFLNRILTRDMRVLSQNKNVPDVIRTTAARTYLKRTNA